MSSNKDGFESYLVTIGHRHGKRYAERHYLNVPVDVARGRLERVSELQLRELSNDCIAEIQRQRDVAAKRAEIKRKTANYDPFASQIRGDHS